MADLKPGEYDTVTELNKLRKEIEALKKELAKKSNKLW